MSQDKDKRLQQLQQKLDKLTRRLITCTSFDISLDISNDIIDVKAEIEKLQKA
jgi:putative NADPH-quinone reductase